MRVEIQVVPGGATRRQPCSANHRPDPKSHEGYHWRYALHALDGRRRVVHRPSGA